MKNNGSSRMIVCFVGVFALFIAFKYVPLNFGFVSLGGIGRPVVSNGRGRTNVMCVGFTLCEVSVFCTPIFDGFLFCRAVRSISFLCLANVSLLPFLCFFPMHSGVRGRFFGLQRMKRWRGVDVGLSIIVIDCGIGTCLRRYLCTLHGTYYRISTRV